MNQLQQLKKIIEKNVPQVITNIINIVPNEINGKDLKNILVPTKETPLIIIPKKGNKEEIDVIKNIL